MRILSKTTAIVAALALQAVACSRLMPWRNQIATPELNLAFTLERNLIEFQTVRLGDRPGRFLLGSAAPHTVIDPQFSRAGRQVLQLSGKESVRLIPERMDLGGVADAIIGIEAWRKRSVAIDYRRGLVTIQRDRPDPGLMKMFRYDAAPTISVNVDGHDVLAIVDTTSPDSIVLPREARGRGTARVLIGDTDFGSIDVGYANIAQARVGNRLLSKFLVTIDYGRQTVGLWRDPLIPL